MDIPLNFRNFSKSPQGAACTWPAGEGCASLRSMTELFRENRYIQNINQLLYFFNNMLNVLKFSK